MSPFNDHVSCLALHVMNSPANYLGSVSISNLKCFLSGAAWRASLTQKEYPRWKIYGPLESSDFINQFSHQRIVDDDWRPILEMAFFDSNLAMQELALKSELWMQANSLDKSKLISFPHYSHIPIGLRVNHFLEGLKRRPNMYVESTAVWHFFCFINGLRSGGDELGLPQDPLVTKFSQTIFDRSNTYFGSEFAAFKIHQDMRSLIDWVWPEI